MKIPKIVQQVMALLMVLFMVGSMLMSALPLSAANNEINLRRVGGYPRITFYNEKGEAIEELTDLEINDESLSFDSQKVSYQNKDKKIDIKKMKYSRFDILLAYADYNRPLTEEERQEIKENGAGDFVQNSTAVIQLGNEEVEATQIDFGVSTSGYLIAKMLFAGVNFLDDENNELTLYMQYLTKDEDGKPTMAKGNTQYKMARVETPYKKVNGTENPDGDANFGDGSVGDLLPEEEVVIKSSTPYIIVEEYSFAGGSTQVSAGSSFNLNLLCRNTHSKIDLENILMKVSTSEGLQITNSSNTFYLDKLGDSQCFEKDLTISALSNAEAKSHTVTVSFTYEYVADDARQQGEMTQDISIPVVQQDRFSADPIENVSDVIVGDEIDVVSKYMNKSRGQLYNLTAELICDESVFCEEKIQHSGNLQAGISGEMEFSLSGSTPGTFSCEIVYSYEDALGNVKETRVPFDVTFVEAPIYEWDQPSWDEPVMDDTVYDEFGNPIDPFAEEQGLSQNQMILIGAAAAVVVILAVVIVKKRKAKKEFEDDDENF